MPVTTDQPHEAQPRKAQSRKVQLRKNLLDPGFEQSRRFYTCQGVREDGGAEIQVIAWTVDPGWTTATRVADPLVDDIPVNERTGRHGGCRLRFDDTGALLVGTGDNAVASNAQDLGTVAGKVLRVYPATGEAAAGNPHLRRPDADYGRKRSGCGQDDGVSAGDGHDRKLRLVWRETTRLEGGHKGA